MTVLPCRKRGPPPTPDRGIQSPLGSAALSCGHESPARTAKCPAPQAGGLARVDCRVGGGAFVWRLGSLAGVRAPCGRGPHGRPVARAAAAHRDPGAAQRHAGALGPDQPRRQPRPAGHAVRTRRGNRRPARRRGLLRAFRRCHCAAPWPVGARAHPAAAGRAGVALHRHAHAEPQPRRRQRGPPAGVGGGHRGGQAAPSGVGRSAAAAQCARRAVLVQVLPAGRRRPAAAAGFQARPRDRPRGAAERRSRRAIVPVGTGGGQGRRGRRQHRHT